ncbi:MAG: glycosyltransferase family 61 protein [Acetobacteraceae bacterium]
MPSEDEPAFRNLQEAAAESGSGISYRSLSDRADSLPSPPRFTFGCFDGDLASRYYHETVVLGTGLFVASGVEVSGPYCLSQGGMFFESPQLHLDPNCLNASLEYYGVTRSSRRLRAVAGQCAMLIGPGFEIYGHWLMDFLPKLYVLHALGYDIDSLRYLVPVGTPEFGIALLDLLGIHSEQLIAHDWQTETVMADELLMPTLLRTNSRVAPPFADAVGFIARRIVARSGELAPSPHGPRLFISRRLANREMRHLSNRERIEQLAKAAGFAIVHPEQMPLLDQVRLFNGASHIMGEYGSALHGSIFAPSGTIVAALRGSGSPIAGFLQSAVGHALGQPTGYVIGPTRPDDPLESFEIAERDFQLCRALVFGNLPMEPRPGRDEHPS